MDYRNLPKDFEGYKARLLAQRKNRNDYGAIARIMEEANERGDFTADEYAMLCDIANGRDLQ